MGSSPLIDYISSIEKNLIKGNATEHTHRPALKTLIEALVKDITATNEPQRIKCGAPDFIITKGALTVGYIEAKDVGKSLDETEKSEQLSRYRDSLTNLILTDYLEFRWYVNGERHLSVRLGTATKEGKIKRDKEGVEPVAELLNGFLSHQAEAVGTPKELAIRMARLAHLIRNLIVNAFADEKETGSLHKQLAAFQENLIPDLSIEQFADMYAQTIAYGLFAARCTAPDNKDFTRQNAAYLLPKTNPFLRKLFNHIAGPELDDRIAWLVNDLAQVLAQADMEAVLKDFGKHMGKEDPVVHFYETFLKAYDPKVREMRGVYYTPEPVVSYIVRSIDQILKTRFNKPQGLADDKTLILDPAVGTATFLYMIINEIHNAHISQGQQGTWNEYVTDKLLPRIFGFELLMAPYAVAHLKLGLLLQETGYKFESDQRLGIYLTNTLEEAFKKSEQLAGFNEYIVDEANAAAEIKKDKPIMVVLGNPPYSTNSVNNGKWITQLVSDYRQIDGKPLRERNSKALQDDYVKFIRFGQWRINKTEQGILVFITNHTYLDNPVFRGMRYSLLNTFDEIYILNLHGNSRKKEVCPDGNKDENVFDIQQGVSISIFVKRKKTINHCDIYHADIWGKRETKYQTLSETDIATTQWLQLKPCKPFYLFVPREEQLRPEYEEGWKINEVFTVNSDGVKTHRDHFVVGFDESSLRERIVTFRGTSLSNADICDMFDLTDKEGWTVAVAREYVRKDNDWDKSFRRYLYRPFDIRYIFYNEAVIERARVNIMRHMLKKPNIAICVGRAGQVVGPDNWNILFCSNSIEDCNLFYRGGTVNLPLYLYPAEGELQFEEGRRRPNLNPEFIKAFSEKLRLEFIEDGKGDLKKTCGPEDIFNYAYAIFHSPTYRTRYAEFLKTDFPRLPLISNKKLFKVLAEKGAELVALHLMESPALNSLITRYPVTGSNTVEKVAYVEETQRVYINKEQYFEGVPSEVWAFQVGGYQVCHKWLKDRKGRSLTYDELKHYQKVVVALRETMRLMAEIDGLIPGWPIE